MCCSHFSWRTSNTLVYECKSSCLVGTKHTTICLCMSINDFALGCWPEFEIPPGILKALDQRDRAGTNLFTSSMPLAMIPSGDKDLVLHHSARYWRHSPMRKCSASQVYLPHNEDIRFKSFAYTWNGQFWFQIQWPLAGLRSGAKDATTKEKLWRLAKGSLCKIRCHFDDGRDLSLLTSLFKFAIERHSWLDQKAR